MFRRINTIGSNSLQFTREWFKLYMCSRITLHVELNRSETQLLILLCDYPTKLPEICTENVLMKGTFDTKSVRMERSRCTDRRIAQPDRQKWRECLFWWVMSFMWLNFLIFTFSAWSETVFCAVCHYAWPTHFSHKWNSICRIFTRV